MPDLIPGKTGDDAVGPTSAAADEQGAFVLECFALHRDVPALVPARPERVWMDRVHGRNAYRCLPLTIANGFGWELLSPFDFEILWTGGLDLPDLTFRAELDKERVSKFAVSNFGHGIATFHPGYMFRTPPGWQLLASGPHNDPKHGVAALTGVIETDWLPFTFTMNWKMTRPGTVAFAKGEPFCMIFPVRTGDIESAVPVIRDLEDTPDVKQQYDIWHASRTDFRQREHEMRWLAPQDRWQKHYFRGKGPDGKAAPTEHRHKLRTAEPIDTRGDKDKRG